MVSFSALIMMNRRTFMTLGLGVGARVKVGLRVSLGHESRRTLAKLALYVTLALTPSLFQSASCEFCLYESVPGGQYPVKSVIPSGIGGYGVPARAPEAEAGRPVARPLPWESRPSECHHAP